MDNIYMYSSSKTSPSFIDHYRYMQVGQPAKVWGGNGRPPSNSTHAEITQFFLVISNVNYYV
jgi:hypothetical protein